MSRLRAWWRRGALANQWRNEVQRIGRACVEAGMSREEIHALAWQNVRAHRAD